MVILFGFLVFLSIALIARPRIQGSRTALLFLLLIYFALVREPVAQLFEIHYPQMIVKFTLFVMLVTVPVTLLILWGARNGMRLGIAVIASFLFLLPFSRPTLPFLRLIPEWKMRLFPGRFLENLSRVNPTHEDLVILRSYCGELSEENVNRVVAHLRPYPVPASSNECLERARMWQRRKPETKMGKMTEHNDPEWIALFDASTAHERSLILDRLGAIKNGILKVRAVESLTTGNDELIVSAVQYLRQISGLRIGYDPARWNEWLSNSSGQAVSNMFSGTANSPVAQRGFSAIHVLDDLLLAKNEGKDFLTVYLDKHFPDSISETDLLLLREACEEAERRPDSIRKFYQKGLMYFFLALAETSRMNAGHQGDPAKASDLWKISRESLQLAAFPGQDLAQEVNQIFTTSDRDGNGDLNRHELISILTARPR